MKYCHIPLFLLFLIGCSANITVEDLIGGYWVGTAGYKDGKPVGEPYCLTIVTEGLEFKEDGVVYVEEFDENFEYWLEKKKNGIALYFRGENHYISYFVDKINDNEIGLTGKGDIQKKESCYLERK